MTSSRFALVLAAAAASLAPGAVTAQLAPVAPGARPAFRPAAPVALSARIDALARGFNGRVGIAVQSVDHGWRAGWRGGSQFGRDCFHD